MTLGSLVGNTSAGCWRALEEYGWARRKGWGVVGESYLWESCPQREARSPGSCRSGERKDFCKSATTRTKEMSAMTEMKALGFIWGCTKYWILRWIKLRCEEEHLPAGCCRSERDTGEITRQDKRILKITYPNPWKTPSVFLLLFGLGKFIVYFSLHSTPGGCLIRSLFD